MSNKLRTNSSCSSTSTVVFLLCTTATTTTGTTLFMGSVAFHVLTSPSNIFVINNTEKVWKSRREIVTQHSPKK